MLRSPRARGGCPASEVCARRYAPEARAAAAAARRPREGSLAQRAARGGGVGGRAPLQRFALLGCLLASANITVLHRYYLLQALWPSRLRCLQQRVSPGVHSDFVRGQMSEGSVALAPEKLACHIVHQLLAWMAGAFLSAGAVLAAPPPRVRARHAGTATSFAGGEVGSSHSRAGRCASRRWRAPRRGRAPAPARARAPRRRACASPTTCSFSPRCTARLCRPRAATSGRKVGEGEREGAASGLAGALTAARRSSLARPPALRCAARLPAAPSAS